MKNTKTLLVLVIFLFISACSPKPANINKVVTPTPQVEVTPTATFTSTIEPTPTLTLKSQYGNIDHLIGERLIFNDGLNPGTLTITERDLSNPVSMGGDISGFKFIDQVSPDGQWLVFFTNSGETRDPCDRIMFTSPAWMVQSFNTWMERLVKIGLIFLMKTGMLLIQNIF